MKRVAAAAASETAKAAASQTVKRAKGSSLSKGRLVRRGAIDIGSGETLALLVEGLAIARWH